MANDIHVGDIGTEFLVTIKDGAIIVPITSGSCVFLFKTPTGTVFQRPAQKVTDGSDGQAHYFSVAGDLSIKGSWKLQAYLILPEWTGHSDVVEFTVQDNLEVTP